ncbi:MAG TPA: AAA family ATPase [Candidatus Polarisedimenticolaceae bacterium]|nr:AAA family ATPase [Candidatus Polarisedimenticolaceae bacterium]
MKSPAKIYIVGIAGSGKTTLARQLQHELDYTHLDLDRLRYPRFQMKADESSIKPAIDTLLKQPFWIAEGAYTTWSAPLLEAADIIIWLDTGAAASAYRVLKRHVIKNLHGQKHFSNRSTLKLAWGALRSNRTLPIPNTKSVPWRQEIKEALEPYQKKVMRIESLDAANHLNGFNLGR